MILLKVTRSALQNATSVASTLLTTESVVATIKEDAPAMPAGGAGMEGHDVKKYKNCYCATGNIPRGVLP